MKTLILSVSFLMTLSILFTSCEKDDPITEDITENSKIYYLKKVTENDGSYAEYFYDDDNKLIKMESYPDVMKMNFSYNSAGKVSSMLVDDSEGSNTISYEYDENGMLSAASSDNGYGDFTYEYENNKLIRVNSYGNIPGVGTKLFAKFEFDYAGANVSEFREYTLNFISGGFGLSEKISYTHDNKRNPFAVLGIEKTIINIGHEQHASENNCTNRNVLLSTYGDAIGSYDLTFEYNGSGYPISASDGT